MGLIGAPSIMKLKKSFVSVSPKFNIFKNSDMILKFISLW